MFTKPKMCHCEVERRLFLRHSAWAYSRHRAESFEGEPEPHGARVYGQDRGARSGVDSSKNIVTCAPATEGS